MLGACRYTSRLRRASVLGGGSAELQRKARRLDGLKDYLQHVDWIHDRVFLISHQLCVTSESSAPWGQSHRDPGKSTSQHVLPGRKIRR